MRIIAFYICCLALCSCTNNSVTSSNALEEQFIKYFTSINFSLDKSESNQVEKESDLRSDLFYSGNLRKVKLYGFNSQELNEKYILLTIYTYGHQDTATFILQRFKMEKEWRIKEGFYGPIDKNFHSFFQLQIT